MLLPVFHINIRDASNEQFKFTFIEYIDKIRWDELVETGNECVELFFHSLLDSPFGDKPATSQPKLKEHNDFGKSVLNIFLFVLVSHFNVPSIRLQVNGLNLSKTLVFGREGRFNNAFDIVLPAYI